jgi:DNA-binding NarL/FixJ family response regulator
MIFLCSRNAELDAICADLGGGRNNMARFHDIRLLAQRRAGAADLLVIDLKGCRDQALPPITLPALALAEVPDFDQALRLLRRGVRGYGNRHMQLANLRQAARAVRAGQVWMPPAIISRVITAFSQVDAGDARPVSLEKLSKREAEVARWVAKGLSNKELADRLHISVRTVKAHLTSIFSKTGFRDRLELAIKMKQA